jgi:hypothetical protein
MPDLKPGQPVLVRGGTFVKADGGAVAVHHPNTIGHLWHDKADVSPDADVSELVEALRPFAAIKFWPDKRPDVQGDSIKAEHSHRARAALAKFEAANA